jgi:hypothetical protein
MSGAWLEIPIYLPPKLDVFLISHWAEKRDGLPELFFLTPSDLTLACIGRLGDEKINQQQVVKARQRLGLKGFRRTKLCPKYRAEGMVFPDTDK